MKRYAMGYFQGAPAMFEQPTGDYVKWDDVRSLLLHLQPPARGWTLATMAASLEELRQAAHDSGVTVGEPIPPGIYYILEMDNFYSEAHGHGQGNEFYAKWKARAAEFPQPARGVAQSETAPASLRPRTALTDAEIHRVANYLLPDSVAFARAIEAKVLEQVR